MATIGIVGRAFTRATLPGLIAIVPALAQRPAVPTDSIIRAVIGSRVDAKLAPGVVVGFLDPDGRRRIITYGTSGTSRPLDGNTVFEIGSITKTFTGTILADMALAGELGLDDPLSRHMPGGRAPSRDGREITLLDLATHTSGLPRGPDNMGPIRDPLNPAADYTADMMHAFLAGHALRWRPGAEYEYSNLGFMTLSDVVTRRAGAAAWEDVVIARVLAPLGMRDTRETMTDAMRSRLAAGHDEGGYPSPLATFAPTLGGGGQLKSTANDMLIYLAANLDAARNPRRTRLSAALEAAQRDRRGADTGRVGLAWQRITLRNGDTLVFKGGGTAGWRSLAAFIPARGTAIIVLVNSALNHYDLGLHLIAPELPLAPPSRPAWALETPLALAPDILDRYTGTYERGDGVRVIVSRVADTLFVALGQGPRRRMLAASERSFTARGVSFRFAFRPDSVGRFSTLVIDNNGRESVARRVSSADADSLLLPELRRMNAQLLQAEQERDTASMRSLIAPNFMWIRHDARRFGREARIAAVARGERSPHTPEILEEHARSVAPDVAVAIRRLRTILGTGKQQREREIWETRVYVRSPSGWRLSAQHSTAAPDPATDRDTPSHEEFALPARW